MIKHDIAKIFSIIYLMMHFISSGLPGKPNPPLECTDITGDSCKLKWKQPNEGLPIDHYKVGWNYCYKSRLYY